VPFHYGDNAAIAIAVPIGSEESGTAAPEARKFLMNLDQLAAVPHARFIPVRCKSHTTFSKELSGRVIFIEVTTAKPSSLPHFDRSDVRSLGKYTLISDT
jgi:hypothetical protein